LLRLLFSSADGAQYLYPVALGELHVVPSRPANDLAVEGHSNPSLAAAVAPDDSIQRSVVVELGVRAVEPHPHDPAPVAIRGLENLCGEKGVMISGAAPVASKSAMAHPVTGASRTPLR